MTTHQWFVEQRTAYVIRSLDPDEEQAFLEHLPGCEECRGEVMKVERELAWLSMGGQRESPRPGVKRRLVEAALGARPTRQMAPVFAAAAALLLAVGATGWATLRVRSAERVAATERERLSQQLAMVRDTLEITRNADRVRHASIQMGNQQAGMVIFADDRSHRWNVVVYGLPAPKAGEEVQFWFITETGMVRGVEVKTSSKTPVFLTLPMPPTGGAVMGAALTMEAEGSSSASPRGKELAHLMM